jgi:hypothetical protein
MSIHQSNQPEAPLGVIDTGLARAWLDDRVIFMRDRTARAPCASKTAFGAGSSLLHVVLAADDLIVTEAEDLHRPGSSIRGRMMLDMPGCMVFRLGDGSAAPPEHLRLQCRPAAGIAVLSLERRRWRLTVTGFVDGDSKQHDRIVDAIEEPIGG